MCVYVVQKRERERKRRRYSSFTYEDADDVCINESKSGQKVVENREERSKEGEGDHLRVCVVYSVYRGDERFYSHERRDSLNTFLFIPPLFLI